MTYRESDDAARIADLERELEQARAEVRMVQDEARVKIEKARRPARVQAFKTVATSFSVVLIGAAACFGTGAIVRSCSQIDVTRDATITAHLHEYVTFRWGDALHRTYCVWGGIDDSTRHAECEVAFTANNTLVHVSCTEQGCTEVAR